MLSIIHNIYSLLEKWTIKQTENDLTFETTVDVKLNRKITGKRHVINTFERNVILERVSWNNKSYLLLPYSL